MEKVIFLFLRRMRAPLLMLILSYSISISGLVLIPGQDNDGNVWHYDFFHAFYFISFVGPTIGFGEIPYELTPGQRMWVNFALYLTVISWFYALGKIFALVQDPAFSRAMTEARFIRAVRTIREPFFIVCGFGETGSLLVRSLVGRQIQCVVIERNQENISNLQLEELVLDVPSFCGDASETRHLKEAGLKRSNCVGVLAMTDSDKVNVKIAVTSKLLRPGLKVICRAATREAADNMESFDTDIIINPFESFAEHMGMAVRTPSIHLLHRWLVSQPGRTLDSSLNPPKGKWVICGYGRFGQAMARYLRAEGIDITVIESDASRIENLDAAVPERLVLGSGTDPEPLHEAGIESAVGVVAGTDDDADNLSIVMTAKQINPAIFRVARQNRRADSEIFDAANLELVMEPSRVVAWQVLALITVKYLSDFLAEARRKDEAWAEQLLLDIREMTNDKTPQTWTIRFCSEHTPAAMELYEAGRQLRVRDIRVNPMDRSCMLPLRPLMLIHNGENILLPEDDALIAPGDRMLWTGRQGMSERVAWLLHNPDQLEYAMDGYERPLGALGRWWLSRQAKRA
ncbi:MAG: potassium channel family protein [Oceanococcus sp.]